MNTRPPLSFLAMAAPWRSWMVVVALLAAQPLHAAPPAASAVVPSFAPVAEVNGSALLLNGSGVRIRSRLQVYDMALYTPRRVHTTAALLALPGPKKLQFEALLELTGTDLGQLLIRGMQANCSAAQMSRHTPSTTRLIEIFSARSRLLRGESFAMVYIPGKGTQFYIAGQAQGEPVGDAEFFDMILRTWFGPASVDPQLRDQLLGHRLKP